MRRCLPLLILVAALACHRKPSTPPEVVARVGDRMLTLADFKRYLERNAGTDLAQVNPEVASALLDQWIDEIVLSEYAATHGVEVPAEAIAQAVRNDAGSTVIEKRDEMRRQKLIASLNADVADPSDTEIRDEFDKHPNEFKSGEEVRVRQILVHDENLANEFKSGEEVRVRQILVHDEHLATQIGERLKKGEHFEDLSSQYSLAPNAKKGGDIGYVSRGELPKMFEDVIFSLKPGQISNVIRTDRKSTGLN